MIIKKCCGSKIAENDPQTGIFLKKNMGGNMLEAITLS
jgi:hypothetical protein